MYGVTTAAIYKKDITVKGVLADGTKITIPVGGYNVDYDKTDLIYGAGKIGVSKDLTATTLKDVDSKDYDVVVTINKTGDEFVKKLTVKKEAPKAVSAKFANDKDHFISTASVTAIELLSKLEVTDQYGVTYKSDTTPTLATQFGTAVRINFSNVSKETAVDNGTNDAKLNNSATDVTADVKITFPSGYVFSGKFAQH